MPFVPVQHVHAANHPTQQSRHRGCACGLVLWLCPRAVFAKLITLTVGALVRLSSSAYVVVLLLNMASVLLQATFCLMSSRTPEAPLSRNGMLFPPVRLPAAALQTGPGRRNARRLAAVKTSSQAPSAPRPVRESRYGWQPAAAACIVTLRHTGCTVAYAHLHLQRLDVPAPR